MLAAFASFALMGLWEQSMQTLALMLAAVTLSLVIGIPIGDRRRPLARASTAAITPVLDAMQIIPAFAYLMPVVILFSVGPAAAVICTMIYAIPPAVRITALGIRGVTHDTVEAAQRVRRHALRRRCSRCSSRSRGGRCCCRSTRRSCSRSRSW